mmetsp:Transcript_19120/g.45309  ORF Transcript_19120/g.45309 Transcript_19120/m.45309 type:complete len:91 (+) Transcript_19120:171-443(+)
MSAPPEKPCQSVHPLEKARLPAMRPKWHKAQPNTVPAFGQPRMAQRTLPTCVQWIPMIPAMTKTPTMKAEVLVNGLTPERATATDGVQRE